MKIIVCDNYDEMSIAAAQIAAEQIKSNPKSVLGLATGSTPVGMYTKLSEMNKAGDIDFSDIRTFNLDEYYPLAADNDQSYRYFMNKNLFNEINIDINNTHLLNGLCEDTKAECDAFEDLINENGGIDLQILGIGINGHIGFNEPGENLNSRTHLTDLTQNTIEANSRFFNDISEVPTQALTMGMGTILRARKIILLASGKNKHNAVASLLTSDISTDMPASMLKMHGDVTLICDREAYAADRLGIDIGGTEVKFGVLNEKDELVFSTSVSTDNTDAEKFTDDIEKKCREISKDYFISSVGVGTPGTFKEGHVTAVNLPFDDYDLKNVLEKKIGISVRVSNDANCAALGEAVSGVGKKDGKKSNVVLISLGTGVGGGIITDGKIYEGKGSAGEIGHMVIVKDGQKCPCGQNGCFEQYASATALVNNAIKYANENKNSELYKIYSENNKLDGRLFFKAVNMGCDAAKTVLKEYAEYLAIGICNIANIFDPEMIVLSGGITNVGDTLLNPIKSALKNLGKEELSKIIKVSELKGDAGVVGAALLF